VQLCNKFGKENLYLKKKGKKAKRHLFFFDNMVLGPKVPGKDARWRGAGAGQMLLFDVIYRIEGFGNFNYDCQCLKCISCLLSSFTDPGVNPG
jgi:hypothetical protein